MKKKSEARPARGRPAREPTPAEQERVKELVAEGASQRLIGAALGRSAPNLRKFFALELGLEKKAGSEDAPPFKITAAMRRDVAMMSACNEPAARIAKAIGVSEAHLDRFFTEDLERGAARYRLKSLHRLEKLADSGNLGAARQLVALTSPGQAPRARPGYVGKKASALADADAAVAEGGKFSPRAAPRLAAVGGKQVP